MNQITPYTLGLIPARGGSKGIPGKNIRLLGGKPLIHHTCQVARESQLLSRTLVTTDCPRIAAAANEAGIETPFLRPAPLSDDASPMRDVIRHALDWLTEHSQPQPEILVLLQPTAPLRRSQHVDDALRLLLNGDHDSVVSVAPVPQHYNPHWQFRVPNGRLEIYTGEPLNEIVTRRQELETTYSRNGAVYAFRRSVFDETGSFYGRRCAAYVMPAEVSLNLDTMEDWRQAEACFAEGVGSHAAA